jgi:hypothetical protein
MTESRYHLVYATIRRDAPGSSYGFLANQALLKDLLDLAYRAPHDAFLIDAGDGHTRAAHAEAKRSQRMAEYTRERLGTPARTYQEEREALDLALGDPAPDSGPPFLELVLAGNSSLETWVTAQGEPSHVAVLAKTPAAVHCHTPLNQRLLRPNLELCRWFVSRLASTPRLPPDATDPATVLLAAGAFVALARVLDLSSQELVRLANFGKSYLARYLSWEGHTSPESLGRRVRKIREAADRRGFGDQPDKVGRAWLDSSLRHEPWFFEPESLWMQFHWFTASLGLPLAREMALVEALCAWTRQEGA